MEKPPNEVNGALADDGAVTQEEVAPPPPPATNGGNTRWPGTVQSGEFIRRFPTPSYIVDRVFQRKNLYAITGMTGSGKTAVTLRLAACVAQGIAFGPFDTTQGSVVYMAGENPMDVSIRWCALAREMDFDPDAIPVHFVDGVFPLDDAMKGVVQRINELGDVTLVVVDTAAAYFTGKDENDNVQQQAFCGALRKMVEAKSDPCVLVNCHPQKSAKATDYPLLPRGGGGFLNSIDGNVNIHMVQRKPKLVTMRCTPKHRGPEFDTLSLRLDDTDGPTKDDKGNLFTSVIAVPLSQSEAAKVTGQTSEDLAALGRAIALTPRASLQALGNAIGVKKRQVQTLMDALVKQGLAQKHGGHYELTGAGQEQYAAPDAE